MSKLDLKNYKQLQGLGRVESGKGVLQAEKTCVKIQEKRKDLKKI